MSQKIVIPESLLVAMDAARLALQALGHPVLGLTLERSWEVDLKERWFLIHCLAADGTGWVTIQTDWQARVGWFPLSIRVSWGEESAVGERLDFSTWQELLGGNLFDKAQKLKDLALAAIIEIHRQSGFLEPQLVRLSSALRLGQVRLRAVESSLWLWGVDVLDTDGREIAKVRFSGIKPDVVQVIAHQGWWEVWMAEQGGWMKVQNPPPDRLEP